MLVFKIIDQDDDDKSGHVHLNIALNWVSRPPMPILLKSQSGLMICCLSALACTCDVITSGHQVTPPHMRCYYQWSPGHPPHTHPALPGEVHVAALRLLPGDRGVGQQQSAGHLVRAHILPGLQSSQVGGLTILGILKLKHNKLL